MALKPRAIADGVYWVGVNDEVKELFEALWPIPFGISYNAYVVIGSDGVALIDSVDERYAYEYIGKVEEVVGELDRVKYLVVNHLEPDHHGATPYLLERVKNLKLVVTPVASKLIKSLYSVPEDRMVVVKDGDRIELGGKTLRFIHTPWLHWPETMMTYLEEDGVLFSCDAFGSYGALENGVFDDEIDIEFYLEEARRYFSNIVAKYARNVIDALEKLKGFNIKIVAPSHGPIYRSNVAKMLELYRKWSMPDPDKNVVVVVYASMYGRGEKIVDIVVDRLESAGMRVSLHDVSLTHPSYVLSDVVDAYTVVIVYPSYDAGVFPAMEFLLYLLQLKQLGRGRNAAVINTYVWSPSSKYVVKVLHEAGFSLLEPVVETKAIPDKEALANVDRIVNSIVSKARAGGQT